MNEEINDRNIVKIESSLGGGGGGMKTVSILLLDADQYVY